MIAPRRVSNFLTLCVAVTSLFQLTPSAVGQVSQDRAKISQTTAATQSAKPLVRPEPTRTFAVTVTNEDRQFITGLVPETFSVFDGEQQREIETFLSGDMPATVGIL